MSNVQPSPQPGPSPSTKTSDSGSGGFWGKVGDVADFLFGTKSLGRLFTGEGSWGDLANVGVTAASFFIPPIRLLKFAPEALRAVTVAAEDVAKSAASDAAKNAAARTAENAKYLLDHPNVHNDLVHLSQTTDNPEMLNLRHLPSEAEHFIKTGTVPERPVERVGSLSSEQIEPSIAKDMDRFKTEPKEIVVKTDRTIATPKAVAERFGTISGSADESKNVTRGLLEEENAPRDMVYKSQADQDRINYPFLTPEDIAQYRIEGRSEDYIANQNRWEESLGGNSKAVEDFKPAPESLVGRKNAIHEVNAEMPVTPEGKPITRRMEDSLPEELRTGNNDVDRAGWLLSEAKKLENFLKSKPSNAAEIRATKDLWTKKANELQLGMSTEDRVAANELADKLTATNLAERSELKAGAQRGVVDFDVAKETDVAKLTDARENLIKDYRAETDPDLKKAIAVTGKKVSARIEELKSIDANNAPIFKYRPMELENSEAFKKLNEKIMSLTSEFETKDARTIMRSDKFKDIVPTSTLANFSKNKETNKLLKELHTKIQDHYKDADFETLQKTGVYHYDINDSDIVYKIKNHRSYLINEQLASLRQKIRFNLSFENEFSKLSKEEIAKIQQTTIPELKKIIDGDICIAIDGPSFDQILKDGVFKNQFETNSSNGLLNPTVRRDVETLQHDTWLDADPSQRPIYGYIAPSETVHLDSVKNYGAIKIKLKPEIKERSTFTTLDSLDTTTQNTFEPSLYPARMDGHADIKELLKTIHRFPKHLVDNPWEWKPLEPLTAWQGRKVPSYAEAQIFGKINLDHIAEIRIKKSDYEKMTGGDAFLKWISPESEEILKQKGIKIVIDD